MIVIDDGSKDATAAIVEDNPHPWLRLLRQPRNMGKAAALNRGLAEPPTITSSRSTRTRTFTGMPSSAWSSASSTTR